MFQPSVFDMLFKGKRMEWGGRSWVMLGHQSWELPNGDYFHGLIVTPLTPDGGIQFPTQLFLIPDATTPREGRVDEKIQELS